MSERFCTNLLGKVWMEAGSSIYPGIKCTSYPKRQSLPFWGICVLKSRLTNSIHTFGQETAWLKVKKDQRGEQSAL